METPAAVVQLLRRNPLVRLIGIAGIPGSGKTTLARKLAAEFPESVILPMDGYHLPRKDLDAEGLRRRGAAHTFAAAALQADLFRLRRTGAGTFPGWSHERKDPDPDAIRVKPSTPRIFVEGLYVLMESWRLRELFDLTIFVDCEVELAMRRVAERSVECGIVGTWEEALARVEVNDRLNAQAVLDDGGRARADLIVSA